MSPSNHTSWQKVVWYLFLFFGTENDVYIDIITSNEITNSINFWLINVIIIINSYLRKNKQNIRLFSGAVLGMVLGGSCKFRTMPFILRMHKYSAVKNLIRKYFRHSHSSRVQPSELVQGGFEADVNITMYVK